MFSFTNPSYPNAALGIEADGISAVALSGGKGRYTIRQAASVQMLPDVLVPSFTDTNIQDNTAFANALTEVIEIPGLLGQKRWSVALPSNTARTAILALETEPANSKELGEVLDWKAEQTFGTPAAGLRLSTNKISSDKDGRSRFFVTAVTLAVIDEYESHFESRGWKAGLILPRPVSEANWLMNSPNSDSMLISETNDGFTAMLIRGQEPAVVRSVTCTPAEIDDEIYRLVMFYNDRVGGAGGSLDRVLVVGHEMVPASVRSIAAEALGRDIHILTAADVGLDIPSTNLNFNDLAAPAGLAALGA
jgi:hypothetical protein